MTFKINKIKKSKLKKSYGNNSFFFEITVKFEANEEEVYFGMLGKYFKALALLDREKYEHHYDNLGKDDIYFEDIPGSENKILKRKSASPYELGYCKALDCVGTDTIQSLGNNKFKYCQFISSNYITEAAVKQLEEMKQHIDKNYCRYGDFPTQVGAFRSGDTFSDFIGVLETLDRFWD
jgi:hypothetical protein